VEVFSFLGWWLVFLSGACRFDKLAFSPLLMATLLCFWWLDSIWHGVCVPSVGVVYERKSFDVQYPQYGVSGRCGFCSRNGDRVKWNGVLILSVMIDFRTMDGEECKRDLNTNDQEI
jgi:hypothetical protein